MIKHTKVQEKMEKEKGRTPAAPEDIGIMLSVNPASHHYLKNILKNFKPITNQDLETARVIANHHQTHEKIIETQEKYIDYFNSRK